VYPRCWLGKGQVENQVDNIREWLFTPRAKFNNFADLNAWLAKRCEELAQRKHPVYTSQTIAECYQKNTLYSAKSHRPSLAILNIY